MYIFGHGWWMKIESCYSLYRYLRSMTILLPLCFSEMRFDFLKFAYFLSLSLSPIPSASLQASFSYPLQEGMPFDYPCNAYGNNNSTNHNHHTGSSIHVNSSIAAGLGELLSMGLLLLTTNLLFVLP